VNDPGTHTAIPFTPRGPARFGLGAVVATPAALDLMRRHETNPFDLLRRHQAGDWGFLGVPDCNANEMALRTGARLLSAYPMGGELVWIITEAVGEDGVKRASTCLLLPAEY